MLQHSGQRPPSRLEQVSPGTFHLVGLPDDFIASLTSGPGDKRRLLLHQSNALPPLLLEQQNGVPITIRNTSRCDPNR